VSRGGSRVAVRAVHAGAHGVSRLLEPVGDDAECGILLLLIAREELALGHDLFRHLNQIGSGDLAAGLSGPAQSLELGAADGLAHASRSLPREDLRSLSEIGPRGEIVLGEGLNHADHRVGVGRLHLEHHIHPTRAKHRLVDLVGVVGREDGHDLSRLGIDAVELVEELVDGVGPFRTGHPIDVLGEDDDGLELLGVAESERQLLGVLHVDEGPAVGRRDPRDVAGEESLPHAVLAGEEQAALQGLARGADTLRVLDRNDDVPRDSRLELRVEDRVVVDDLEELRRRNSHRTPLLVEEGDAEGLAAVEALLRGDLANGREETPHPILVLALAGDGALEDEPAVLGDGVHLNLGLVHPRKLERAPGYLDRLAESDLDVHLVGGTEVTLLDHDAQVLLDRLHESDRTVPGRDRDRHVNLRHLLLVVVLTLESANDLWQVGAVGDDHLVTGPDDGRVVDRGAVHTGEAADRLHEEIDAWITRALLFLSAFVMHDVSTPSV